MSFLNDDNRGNSLENGVKKATSLCFNCSSKDLQFLMPPLRMMGGENGKASLRPLEQQNAGWCLATDTWGEPAAASAHSW